MATIKSGDKSRLTRFLNRPEGEFCLVAASGALLWALAAEAFARLAIFASDTLYPFTYPFFHTPLHALLPQLAYRPPFAANLIFGAIFTYAVYRFEKNVFYRRLHKTIRAAFGAVAACVFVFLSGLLAFIDDAGVGLLSPLFLSAEVDELPLLSGYYFIGTIGIISYCDVVRRQIFLLP